MPFFYSLINCDEPISKISDHGLVLEKCRMGKRRTESGRTFGMLTDKQGREYEVAVWTPEIEVEKKKKWCLVHNIFTALVMATVISLIATMFFKIGFAITGLAAGASEYSVTALLCINVGRLSLLVSFVATVCSVFFLNEKEFAEQAALRSQTAHV